MSDSWWEAGAAGIGDALGYEPVRLILKAPLRMAQRRFPEAIKLLDQAVALYLEGEPEQRDPHLAGRSLVAKSAVLIEMGESEAAIQTLRRADGLIEPERDPRLVLCIRHNLVDNLSKVGRHAEAAGLLPRPRGGFPAPSRVSKPARAHFFGLRRIFREENRFLWAQILPERPQNQIEALEIDFRPLKSI